MDTKALMYQLFEDEQRVEDCLAALADHPDRDPRLLALIRYKVDPILRELRDAQNQVLSVLERTEDP